MVICPQVLQAGASLCMLFAAALMASIPTSAFLTVAFTGFKDSVSGDFAALPGTTRTSLNGGVFFRTPVKWEFHPIHRCRCSLLRACRVRVPGRFYPDTHMPGHGI